MSGDLVVLGQDPRFGGGGRALSTAFLDGATALGREPTFLYQPHPGLGRRRGWPRRIEAIHQLRTARALTEPARAAESLWVVATSAPNGAAAPRARRPYDCWIATTVDAEWAGRAPGLAWPRRQAAALSLPILRRLERSVLQGARRIFATSTATRDRIAEAAGLGAEQVAILPIPIDTDEFTPEDDDVWIERARSSPLIGFVGRADDPRKNVQLLLDAFQQIRAALPNTRLRLIGRPPRGSLEDGIMATGVVDDVAPPLRECALFVLPSLQEGFGIAAAEALAAGVPIVTTPSGGPEDLVRESDGGMVMSTFTASELADACIGLIEDPRRLLLSRHAGRAYVATRHSRDAFLGLLGPALVAPSADA